MTIPSLERADGIEVGQLYKKPPLLTTGNHACKCPEGRALAAQTAAGESAGVVAAVDDDLTVDDDRGDADRVAVGLVVGRLVSDPRGVEDGHVRPRAFAEHAAVFESERRGRGGGGPVK